MGSEDDQRRPYESAAPSVELYGGQSVRVSELREHAEIEEEKTTTAEAEAFLVTNN